MKQKVVLRVEMNDAKKRTKAMRIVFGIEGVQSAGFRGADQNQIVVKGKGIDSVTLVTLIRKKVGYTELISQTNIYGDQTDDDEEEETEPRSVVNHPIVRYPYNYCAAPAVQQYPYEYRVAQQYPYDYHGHKDYDSCNIL